MFFNKPTYDINMAPEKKKVGKVAAEGLEINISFFTKKYLKFKSYSRVSTTLLGRSAT